MEKFKEKIQKRLLWMSLITIFTTAVYILLLSGTVLNLPSTPEFIKGFNLGAFIGLEVILIFFMAKYYQSLKKEDSLKKLYIEENDERTKMIMQKTGSVGMTFFTIASAVATIISGFFNETVFFTLLAATVFSSLIRGACKLYYHIKL